MRYVTALLVGLWFVPTLVVQARQQTGTHTEVVQADCHDLSAGSALGVGETLINGKACRLVGTIPQPVVAAGMDAPKSPMNVATTPTESGMYLVTKDGFTKILGEIVDFQRSGSVLVSKVTIGIKSNKTNVQLLGPHAQTVTGSEPEFYFVPAKQEAEAGVNAGDLILIRLEEKPERRQFEVAAQGMMRASSGISITQQVQLFRSEVVSGVYKITPAGGLAQGEYGLYLSRGEGMSPYIYDFSVELTAGGSSSCCEQPHH
jgi:hypothetical protein